MLESAYNLRHSGIHTSKEHRTSIFLSGSREIHPYARIEIVRFLDEAGDNMEENIFRGPIHKQLRDALKYLENQVIKKRITKFDDKAEAPKTSNYPYAALEEILSNAVYHKSWDDRNPIEVRINEDSIQVYSMAGPMPPITNKDLHKEHLVCRNYRNRRIGDFLKELDMTEGRSTGFPKIYKALRRNGSPEPLFETDDKNQYFLATVKIHPIFLEGASGAEDVGVNVIDDVMDELTDRQRIILKYIKDEVIDDVIVNASSLAKKLGVTWRTIMRDLAVMKDKGLIKHVGPDNSGHWEIIKN